MIYLNSAQFRPLAIIISLTMLPLVFSIGVLTIIDFRIEILLIFLIFLVSYLIVIFMIYKNSLSNKYYLNANNEYIEIKYPNVGGMSGELVVDYDNIIKIEYYKISSIKSWLMLFNYVCPDCAYITYKHNNKEICEHIGYAKYKDLRALCNEKGINLIVY